MRKKQILSMLLAAAIGCSGMSVTASAEGNMEAEDSESNAYVLDDGWVFGSTSATFVTDVVGDGEKAAGGDNEYLHINNEAPTSSALSGGAYTDNVTLEKGKTYRFTMWLRSAPTYIDGKLNENTYSIFLGYDLNQNHLFKVGTNNKIEVLAVDGEGIDKTTGKVTLGDTWTKYTSVFTALENVPFKHTLINGGVIFMPVDRTAGDGTPFDLDGFSLYEAEITVNGYQPKADVSNLVSMNKWKWADRSNWYSMGATRDFRYETPYFSVAADSINTEVKYIPDENTVIEPGVYELTGDFRLGDILYEEWIDSPAGGNEAVLTASIGGMSGVTADSADNSFTVNNDWTSAKFIFDIRDAGVKLGDIEFMLDEARALDFNDVKLTRTAAYSSEWLHQNGGYVMEISEAADFENYVVATSNKDKTSGAAFGYRSDALTNAMAAETGSYELSFWLRDVPAAGSAFDTIIVTLGSEYSSEFILSKLGKTGDSGIGYINVTSIEGETTANGRLAVSDKWQKYTVKFELDGGLRNIDARGIRFNLVSNTLEVGGLKLVRTDTNTEIIDDNELKLANWYTDNLYCSTASFDKKPFASNYFTAEAVAGQDTVVRSGSDETIPMGVYELSGQFRADSAAKLTVSNGNQTVGTADISTNWTIGKVELKLKKETALSDIIFSLDGSYTFDLANIKFEKISDYTDDYVYLNGDAVAAIEENAEFGSYITATNTKDNAGEKTAFGYKSDELTAAIEPGSYEISFWLRADSNADGAFDKVVATLGTEFSSEFILSSLGKTGNESIGFINVTSIDGSTASATALAPAADWQKYTINFEVIDGVRNIAQYGIRFHAVSEALDVGGLKLIRTDTNETIIDDKSADLANWYTDNVYCSKASFETKPFIANYYRAEAVTGTSTGIRVNSTATLPMGIYEVSGKFRAGSDAILTVSREGENPATANVSSNWENIKLEFKLKKDASLSEIIFELDGSYDFDFTGITFKKIRDYSKDYTYTDGEPVTKVTEKYDFDSYISAVNTKDISPSTKAAFGYRSDELTAAIEPGAYELSFWLRADSNADGAFDKVSVTLGTEFSSEFLLSSLGKTGDEGIGFINVTSIDGSTASATALAPAADWQKYTINFEVIDGVRNIAQYGIRFHAVSEALDVGGLKLVKTDTSETIIDDKSADLAKWYTDNVYCSKASFEAKLVIENYYRANSVPGESTAITFGSDEILPMGVYKFRGNFRADTDAALNLTASVAGTDNETVEISSNWTECVFTVRLKAATPMSQIAFTLDGEYGLDFIFDAPAYEKEADYLTDFSTADGSPVVAVVEEVEFPAYVHAVNSKDSTDNSTGKVINAAFGYKSDELTAGIEPGSYELSFWLRDIPAEGSDFDTVIVSLGSQFSSESILSKLGESYYTDTDDNILGTINVTSIEGEITPNGRLAPTAEWQKYTVNFDVIDCVRNIAEYGIRFHLISNILEVGGLKLVNTDTSEIIIDDKSADLAKWYTDNVYCSKASFEAKPVIANYYRAEGIAGQFTGISPSSTDTLEAGLYYVSGKFRVGPGNDAAANISANLGNAVLKTHSGFETTNLSNDWKEVTFVIDTAVDGINVSDLEFMLDSDVNLEFADFEIEQIERYVYVSDINLGTVVTLLVLKKAYSEGRAPLRDYGGVRVELPIEEMPVTKVEGNVIERNALVRSKNWIYGEQTIRFSYSDDGSICVSARDITDNRTGFTFSPNVAIRSGVYRFSGEFRTANPGETSVIRVYAGGKMLLFTITNEWTPVEVMFETNEKTPIEFTVKGGPVAWYTQDFDMRKLSITDMASEPIDVVVSDGGDFEGVNSLSNWSPGTSAGTLDRVTEDGNTFMRNTKRTLNYTGIYYTLPDGIIMGVAYKISYDIRTSNPGETMTARAHYYEGDNKENVDLIIAEGASNKVGNEFEITNEWRHVESTFVATLTGKFRVGISGGQSATDDIKPFDIDNFTIERLNYGVHLDEYTAGDFEDPLTATARWSAQSGAGTIIRVEEDGNAFLRNTERTVNYQNLLLSTSIPVKPGTTVRIAYDVRTAVPGETSVLRANIRIGGSSGIIDLPLMSGATRPGGESYEVTNEWKHVESVYTVRHEGNVQFGICGGPRVEYIQAFDIDNLVIEVIG